MSRLPLSWRYDHDLDAIQPVVVILGSVSNAHQPEVPYPPCVEPEPEVRCIDTTTHGHESAVIG